MLATIGGSCFSATVSFVQKSKDINKANYRIDQKYPYLTARTPLAKAVNKEIRKILDNSENNILSALSNKTHEVEYSAHSTFQVTYSDYKLFSAGIYLSEYTGGTHPDNYSRVVNFASNGKQVSRVTLTDIIKSDPDSINNLKELLMRKTTIFNNINEISDESLETFLITPSGIIWIFHDDRVYNVMLNWNELSDIQNSNAITYNLITPNKTFVTSNKTNVRIDGDAFLLDNVIAPKGSKLQIRLVWILADPSRAPKVIRTYEKPFIGNSVPYNLVFDWRKLDEKNEYQVQFNVIYKNDIVYNSALTMVLSVQGWPQDTLVALKNINY